MTAAKVPSSVTKKPSRAVSVDFFTMKPAWRVSMLEMCDPFGWHLIVKEKVAEIRNKLGEFEKLTWREILVDQSNRNHAIQVDQLTKEARIRLAELGQDDVDEVISLRLSSRERVFGIKHVEALMLLWWDPDHRVCPAQLKHT
jgi:hypothetical protein